MKSKSEEAFWGQFTAVMSMQTGERRPDGPNWKTREEIAKGCGMNSDRVSDSMNKAVALGRAERFEGSIRKGNRLVRCVWFRPKSRA